MLRETLRETLRAQVRALLETEGFGVVGLRFDRGLVGGRDGANAGKEVNKGTVYIEDRLKVILVSSR